MDWNRGGQVVDEVSPLRTPQERGVNDPERFFGTRHSVRDYDDRPVQEDLLMRAVELAINTPSACNRQAWHVRFFRGNDVVRVLRHQNGNSGFAENVPCVAVVTVDARLFAGAGERNQGWIEGGLFSMSLLYWALHSLGADGCMLNMSLTNEQVAPPPGRHRHGRTRVGNHDDGNRLRPRRAQAGEIAASGHGRGDPVISRPGARVCVRCPASAVPAESDAISKPRPSM
ncbi:nitroreductase family protein [Nocardioides sp. zg-ZUI104]|uniref:nitroreductase family protein n=1 Tax=Nocardioides faecalis TaxID=2803858 RepID=UPI001BCF6001|nr:nitroreductase family protein [Nocardioides faecalis]MBS4753334.1 nitroreductase family protein [Nocardioides faecalis]